MNIQNKQLHSKQSNCKSNRQYYYFYPKRMDTVSEFISSLTHESIYHGGHNGNQVQIALNAGNLSMIYENGNLRYISAGKSELIRMIYTAVRLEGWITAVPEVSEEKIEKESDSFIITYKCLYKSGDAEFKASFRIEGRNNSSLIFSMNGIAITTFRKNRIGLCLLHPLEECCGNDCIITHPDNSGSTLQFPVYISALQPFLDIKTMRWNVSGLNCTVSFSGDIFETEDQRNWTDASFKTYSTPLKLQYPVTIKQGDEISQSIDFMIDTGELIENYTPEVINLTLFPGQTSDMPQIGIGRSTRTEPITGNEIKILKDLPFDHYRVDLYLFDSKWKKTARKSVAEAADLDYGVEFALFFDENAINQANDFIAWLNENQTSIALFTIYHKTSQTTPDELTDTIATLLKQAFPVVKISCGTNANFAQLNRNPPKSNYNSFISYAVHPQEHASDNSTLVENIEAQAYTAESAKSFAGGKGIWISPVNIQRRFNANVENFENILPDYKFPRQADSRMMSLFGACWTAGSLKYLIESGIKGVTYYETVGERGILQGDFNSRWPHEFPSVKGMLFPLFQVFRFILKNKDYKVIKSISSQPLKANILSLTDGLFIRVILINFTGLLLKVKAGWSCEKLQIIQLNSVSYLKAVTDENWIENTIKQELRANEIINLEPYSVSFTEGRLYL